MNDDRQTETVHRTCPKCAAPLPADAPQGLCPKCLLAAVSTPTESGQPPGPRVPAPAAEVVAAAFPQLEIIGLIGQGGMGAVYKARQPKLDRFVALKLLPAARATDPAFAERFNREARLLARLSHPNIVAVYDFGESGGFFFLMMEYVDGVNLRQAMRAGRFSPAQALALVPKICEALQFAHDEGILHRDIKPENLLLDTKGRVKIADFGIAKLVGQTGKDVTLTASGAALGTPHYMAPEQLEHPEDVDQRADIYSLGVVFYEMLTGELPIGRFAPPSRKTTIDERVDEIVLKALARERESRQQSANEVKTQVEDLQTPRAGARPPGAPESAMAVVSPSPGETATASLAKSRRLITAAGLVCASLVTGLLLALLTCAVQFHWWGVAGGGVGVTISLVLLTVALGLPGTLIGAMAVSEMRKAEDDRGGWPVAIFAALCWPALVLDGLLAVLIDLVLDTMRFSNRPEPVLLLSVTLSTLLTAVLVVVAVRFLWGRRPASTPRVVQPERGSTDEGWSRLAIWGAALTGLSLPVPLLVLMAGLLGMGGIGPGELWVSVGSVAVLGIPGTLLGWMALSQIRRSQGRLQGLLLALFAGLTWPLLVPFLATLLSPMLILTPKPVPWGPALLLLPIGVLLFGVWAVRATARWGSGTVANQRASRTAGGTGAGPASLARFASWAWFGALLVGVIAVPIVLVWSPRQVSPAGGASPTVEGTPGVQTSIRSAALEVAAPPRETLIVSGLVLSNGVPVSCGELRAKLWPGTVREPSRYFVRWQPLEPSDSAPNNPPWEIVVEDQADGTIAARLRPVGLPQLAWTLSPQAAKVTRRTSSREAWTFEVARALQSAGGGNAGAADWSFRLQVQSSPVSPSASKRGIDADFVLPANQVAVFELVTRSNAAIVSVPELAAHVVNGSPEPYKGKFLLADDPDDLDGFTALPRWRFGIIGPNGRNLAVGLAVPPVPPEFTGTIGLWTVLQPDNQVIEGLASSGGSRPTYGLRIRTFAFKPRPGLRYQTEGFGTNWMKDAALHMAPR